MYREFRQGLTNNPWNHRRDSQSLDCYFLIYKMPLKIRTNHYILHIWLGNHCNFNYERAPYPRFHAATLSGIWKGHRGIIRLFEYFIPHAIFWRTDFWRLYERLLIHFTPKTSIRKLDQLLPSLGSRVSLTVKRNSRITFPILANDMATGVLLRRLWWELVGCCWSKLTFRYSKVEASPAYVKPSTETWTVFMINWRTWSLRWTSAVRKNVEWWHLS